MNRNDVCYCGSGKKFKKCHGPIFDKVGLYARRGIEVPEFELLKIPADIEGIKGAAKVNIAVLDEAAKHIRPGISTLELEQIIHNKTSEMGGVPAPLGYEGYPKSCCISLNDVVCHGIPDADTILEEGDILNIDCTTMVNGYYADSSRMFTVGKISESRQRLVDIAKECLELGFAAVKPWGFTGDIAHAVQTHAESNGYSVVTEFGGHGIGFEFHEDPYIDHTGEPGTGMLLVPGMVFTIEPMINEGSPEVLIDEDDGWTAFTEDAKDSAQWEYTVMVTETGAEILTY